jgi:hypothetical protein
MSLVALPPNIPKLIPLLASDCDGEALSAARHLRKSLRAWVSIATTWQRGSNTRASQRCGLSIGTSHRRSRPRTADARVGNA